MTETPPQVVRSYLAELDSALVDRMKDDLMAIAQHNRANITAFIENREVFGDLCDNPRFVAAYTEALQSLYAVGAKETVRRYA